VTSYGFRDLTTGRLRRLTLVMPVAALALALLASCTWTAPGIKGAVSAVNSKPAPTATATSAPSRWTPTPGASWQIQFTGTLDLSVSVATYDVDGFDTSQATVAAIHQRGARASCYVSAGTWENWRPDAATIPTSVRGASNGWAGERWLDIRRLDVLGPILDKRIAMCTAKGFDAVDFDNVDNYTQRTSFPITYADQLTFNRWLAAHAHARNLSVGLKNDLDQVPELVSSFDFAINESCYKYSECGALKPFIAAGKAVLHIEYGVPTATFCPTTKKLGFSSLRKNLDLGAWRQQC
jgi:hypothetical protein